MGLMSYIFTIPLFLSMSSTGSQAGSIVCLVSLHKLQITAALDAAQVLLSSYNIASYLLYIYTTVASILTLQHQYKWTYW